MKKSSSWVLVVIIGIVALICINNKMAKDAIEQCVKGGNEYSYCERGLR